MLLYHPLHKTFDDFNEVYCYILGEMKIETDRELEVGQILILNDISMYAIVIKKIWSEDGNSYILHDTAEEKIVRARLAKNSE